MKSTLSLPLPSIHFHYKISNLGFQPCFLALAETALKCRPTDNCSRSFQLWRGNAQSLE